jgi:hypothetical protein
MKVEQMIKAINGTKFQADLEKSINMNGGAMPIGYYNLIVSIRDCKLYSKGIKPHRNWKISDVKWYFGVKGNAQQIADMLEEYKETLFVRG